MGFESGKKWRIEKQVLNEHSKTTTKNSFKNKRIQAGFRPAVDMDNRNVGFYDTPAFYWILPWRGPAGPGKATGSSL